MIPATSRPPVKDYYWKQILGLHIQSWDEMPVLWMLHQHITPKQNVCHKITTDRHAAHFYWQFWCSEITTCPCRPHGKFWFSHWRSEVHKGLHFVEKAGKTEKQMDPTQQCALSHLPYSATLVAEQPNSNHPSATVRSTPRSMWPLALPHTQDRARQSSLWV